MAENTPAWLNFLQGSGGSRKQEDTPPWLSFLEREQSSRPAEPLRLVTPGYTVSEEDARLQENENLKKQVDRLRRAETQAAIVGAETEKPKGLLGFFQRTAGAAIDNPVVKGIFQAMSVIGAGSKQVLNAIDTAVESDYNPLSWLADRMDEYTYGRVRTREEREQSIEQKLQQIPGAETAGRFATEQLGLQAGEYGRPSFQEFKQDVAGIRGGGEIIPEFKLTEDAGVLEKAWKLPAAFLYDVRSAGGPRGFVRFGSNAMTRKQVGESLGNAAEETFKKYAKQGADETAQAFDDRAKTFAANVIKGNLSNRSRGVRNVFEAEFGKEAGKEAFSALPKTLRGGLGVGPYDASIGNLNAGGYAVDAVARALRIDPKLFGTKWNPVVGYQSLKNNARERLIPQILNNIGIESPAWFNFIKAVNKNATDTDLTQAYKEFMTPAAKDPAGRVAEIFSEEVLPVKQLMNDFKQIRKTQPALYDRVVEMIDNPNVLAGKTELDEFDRQAKAYADNWREQFDNLAQRMIDEGVPMNYLNEYYPIIFNTRAMKDDGVDFTDIFTDEVEKKLGFQIGKKKEVTQAGLVNVPGKGYDPTKDRNIFMEEITDVDGTLKARSSSFKEMRDKLREAGVDEKYIKYLKTDPAEVLADYATRSGKVIARRKLANELYRAGLLFRGVTPRVAVTSKMVQDLITQMRPDQLERLTKDFMRDPARFDEYVGSVNDRLARAYDSGNPETIRQADLEIKSFIDALDRLGDVYVERVMTPNALANYRKLVDAFDEAVDMGDTKAADQLRKKIDQARRDAMKIREETARTRPATIEANVERKAFDDYVSSVLNVKKTSAGEIKSRYNLSNISPLTGDDIKGVARIPDELAGTLASENLNQRLGEWLRYNSRFALDVDTSNKIRDAFNAATQGFRTQATFGRGPGFVVRNAIGAIFNNILVAGVNAVDYTDAHRIWWTRLTTDLALDPLDTLTGKDAEDYLAKLVEKGKLNPDAAALARADIISNAKVKTETVAKIKKQMNIERLGKFKVDGQDYTLADAYETGIEGGVTDPLKSVAGFSGLKRDENLASLLDSDVDWISIRNDRKPIRAKVEKVIIPGTNIKVSVNKPTNPLRPTDEDPRSVFQRATEAYMNVGFDVKTGKRTYNLRPVQLVADFNRNTEEYHRMAAILSGLRQYGNTTGGRQNAITNMKLAQFDYSNLSEQERLFGRSALPFYTWMRNNIPLQIRLLVNQPGTFNTVLEGWDTVKGIFGDENGDMYFMPEYLQETFAFMINPELQEKLGPLMSVLGSDPSNPMAVRLESPILDINRYLTVGGEGQLPVGADFEEVLSGSNPIAKAFIQLIAEKNLYTGRNYSSEGVEAPLWYTTLTSVVGNVYPDMKPEYDVDEGVYKVNERWLDFFKTAIPSVTTVDRTVAPAFEAALEAIGIKVNLSNEEERLLTSLMSSGLGVPVSTVTPEVEAGEVAARYRYAEDQILSTARGKRMSADRVAEFVRNADRAGMAEDEIIRRGQALAESGFFS